MIALLAIAGISFAIPEPRTAKLNDRAMLAALVQVENSPLHFVSRSRCRGVYQLSPQVWRQHSTAPHAWANSAHETHRAETERVARAHLDWLKRELAEAGESVSAFKLGLAWKSGLSGSIGGWGVSKADLYYAQRAENLYEDFSRSLAEAVP